MSPESFDASTFDGLRPLLQRTAGGDQHAFGQLYDALSPRVYGLVFKITGDRALAEEATLETFTQIWRTAAQHSSDRGNVTAWALMIARSRALDALRDRRRQTAGQEPLEDVQEAADPGPGPELTADQEWRARRVRRALATLPADQRRALEAAYFSGLSHREVADALGEPLGTIKTRIRSGVTTLKRLLLEGQEGTV